MNKLLIYDLDGTLTDSVGGIVNACNRTMQAYGLPVFPPKHVEARIGNGIRDLLTQLLLGTTLPAPIDEIIKTMNELYNQEPVCDTYLYPNVADTLQKLQTRGWINAVSSNKVVSVVELIVKELGIAPYCAESVGDGAGFKLKPAPDSLQYLMKKYDVAPENCWMIGDNHTDLAAAKAAGIRSIFCTYGFGHPGEYTYDVKIDSFEQLLEVLP